MFTYCLGTELCPSLNSYIHALSSNMTVCGEEAFEEAVRVK